MGKRGEKEAKVYTNLQEVGQGEVDISRLFWDFAVANVYVWNYGEQQRMQCVTVGLWEPLWPGKLKGRGVKSRSNSLHSHKTHVACL